ncbi:MAG: hypothetical protein LQ349_005571 [Xanthoria aureola]|nr:MAG: hypothetical protein LQ349_005571 [Xanthoria aureola]
MSEKGTATHRESPPPRPDSKSNAATGASAAGARAFSSQLVAFYFRAPVKAFFRTRVDYLVTSSQRLSRDSSFANLQKAFARAINPKVQANEAWVSSAGLLAHAVRTYGWNFIPNNILPPLLANVGVGAILYTSYLQTLGRLHTPSAESLKRVYPPPPPNVTFAAGCTAGAIQSVFAAPLDALSVRFRPTDMLDGPYKSMWQYGYLKTREIGMRGVLAGWTLSFAKDALGYGLFFATFEYVKAQSYYAFITRYYGSLNPWNLPQDDLNRVIRPHYAFEPSFLLLAGMAASVSQQFVQHPIGLLQDIHYRSLAAYDKKSKSPVSFAEHLRLYSSAYKKTFQQGRARAIQLGGWRKWLYKGFLRNTIKQVPSTSAGLIIFELVRRRYGIDVEATRIQKDGYDILLR